DRGYARDVHRLRTGVRRVRRRAVRPSQRRRGHDRAAVRPVLHDLRVLADRGGCPGPPAGPGRAAADAGAQSSLSPDPRTRAPEPASPPPERAPTVARHLQEAVMSATSGRPAQMSADAATAAHGRRARLRAAAAARGVPLAAILVTVAVVVLTYLAGKLAYRLRDVILMILVAGFLAVILNPLVVALQRWRIRRRGWAVTVVIVWATLVFIGLLAVFGYPLTNGLTHFSHQLPGYVQSAEHGSGWIGHLVQRFHLQAWVNHNAPKLQSLGATLAKPALTVGKGAASLLATLATIFALLVLFLLEGPKMRRGLLQLISPDRAAYSTRVAHQVSQSVTGYAFGNLLTSLIAGLVVFVTLTVLGVPF